MADTGQLSVAPEVVLRRKLIKAGKGETVTTVARKYKVSPAQVAQWNKVSATASFKPGQQVVVFLAGSAKSSTGNKRPAARRASPKKR